MKNDEPVKVVRTLKNGRQIKAGSIRCTGPLSLKKEHKFYSNNVTIEKYCRKCKERLDQMFQRKIITAM